MSMTLLYGASSGVLHAVTGPDHLLSLGPVAVQQQGGSWRVGAAWGLGHAVGTLALALPLILMAELMELSLWAAWGQRLAGAALIVMALYGLRRLQVAPHGSAASLKAAMGVGFIHGLTGAGSLVLVLPVLVAGSPPSSLAFLLAFGAGSTAAMAAFTTLLARVGSKMPAGIVSRVQRIVCGAAIALGAYWLAFS
ncbi:MAG TPA: hypothetical protein VER33_15280 [Polyangiaceae bacterium]|nr:hypothetical protein [Polyangiaceae bacterium]